MANYLKKVVVGGQTYDLKDGSSRRALCAMLGLADDAALDAWAGKQLGSLAWETYSITTSVRDSGDALDTALPTEAAVRDALADIVGAMHFIGVSTTDPATGIITIDGQVYSNPQNGDIVIYQDSEYVFVENQQHENEWHKLGDENLYVKKTDSIAGITYGENSGVITEEALATALELGNFAFTSTATATVAAQSITNAQGSTTYTPAGTIEFQIDDSGMFFYTDTYNYTAVTEITADSAAPAAVTTTVTDTSDNATLASTTVLYVSDITDVYTADVIETVDLVADANTVSGVLVEGEISAPTLNITLSNTPVVNEVNYTAPSFTEGVFTAATLSYTTSLFATEGVTVTVGSGNDSETLFFSSVSTGSASSITAFNGGSKASDTWLAGSLTASTINVADNVSSAVADAPVFSATKSLRINNTTTSVVSTFSVQSNTFSNVTGVTYTKQAVSVTATVDIDAAITTETTNVSTEHVEGFRLDSEDNPKASATFTGTQATITVPVSTFTVPAQTVTVTAPAHTYNA